jgi:hypothetical protein
MKKSLCCFLHYYQYILMHNLQMYMGGTFQALGSFSFPPGFVAWDLTSGTDLGAHAQAVMRVMAGAYTILSGEPGMWLMAVPAIRLLLHRING